MSDTDRQEKYVFHGYLIQWATIVFPPAIIASLVYLLVIRPRITHPEVRSHVNWQLMTCGLIAAMIPLSLAFVAIALSGVSSDSPLSIAATFVLLGGSLLFLPWLLYRLLRGTIMLSKQLPMPSLFP